MASLQVLKVIELPEVFEPHSLYLVIDPSNGSTVNSYITDAAGELKRIGGNGKRVITPEGVFDNCYEYVAVVDAVNGDWTIDYTAAGFTKVLFVDPTAIAANGDLAGRRVSCLGHVPYTNTRASGKLMGATVTGLIVNTMVEATGKVQVVVTGF